MSFLWCRFIYTFFNVTKVTVDECYFSEHLLIDASNTKVFETLS